MAWVLLLLGIFFFFAKVIRVPNLAIMSGFLIPIIFILYLATVSPSLAKFVAIIVCPILIVAFVRLRSQRNKRR